MVSKMIRVAINRFQPDATIIEYGEWAMRPLSADEVKELEVLNQELLEYSDFTTAAELDDETQRRIRDKRKRLEELEAIRTGEPKLEWRIQDPHEIESVLLVIRPRNVPIYVEGLTDEMIQKILAPHLTLNIGGGVGTLSPTEEPIQPTDTRISEINAAIGSIKAPSIAGKPWLDLVVISTTNPAAGSVEGQTTLSGTIYVMPVRFLKDDWGPINDRLNEIFGDRALWHRAGKTSHWTVKF
jgi:hypothetical protein